MSFFDPWFPEPPLRPPAGAKRLFSGSVLHVREVYQLTFLGPLLFGMFVADVGAWQLSMDSWGSSHRLSSGYIILIMPLFLFCLVWWVQSEVVERLIRSRCGPTIRRRRGLIVRAAVSSTYFLILVFGCWLFRLAFVVEWSKARISTPPRWSEMSLHAIAALPAGPGLCLLCLGCVGLVRQIREAHRIIKQGQPYNLVSKEFARSRSARLLLTVAHLSDLHLTTSDADQRVGGGSSGNISFRKILAHTVDRLGSVDAIVITGDITDSGRGAEWKRFFEAVPPELHGRCVLIPGNHDVNITLPDHLTAAEGLGRPLRNLRLMRGMAAIDRIQGDRAWVWAGEAGIVSFREALAGHRLELEQYLADPAQPMLELAYSRASGWLSPPSQLELQDITDPETERRIDVPFRVWHSLFPMAVQVPGSETLVLAFDSNDVADSIIGNAYGLIDDEQLSRTNELLSAFPKHRVIYALHHHVALPTFEAESGKGRFLAHFTALLNGKAVLDTINRLPSVVFHGHRHVHFTGVLGHVEVVSAPSTTLGDAVHGPEVPHYYLYGLVPRDARGVSVDFKEKEALAA